MPSTRVLALVLSLGAAGCAPESSGPLGVPHGGDDAYLAADDPIPGRYIVALSDKRLRGAHVATVAVDLAADYAADVTHVYSHALTGFAVEMTAEDARALARDARVLYVEEDAWIQGAAVQANPPWGLDRIDQRDHPLDGAYAWPSDGAGITVYVVDSGIRASHQSFGGRAEPGFTAVDDGRGAGDCNGHGTHVAGTVGSDRWGVAKRARLVSARVFDCESRGLVSGAIAALDWVIADSDGPSVANLSLSAGPSTALDSAVRRAVDQGIVVVVSAGNDGADACRRSPARVVEALTVGATTRTDHRSPFSNHGPCVDLFAPGSAVASASASSDTAASTMSGTSMASHHVAGAAALYLGAHPAATPAEVRAALLLNATAGRLADVKEGSPNALLYTGFIGVPGEPAPDPPAAGTPRTGSASGSLERREEHRYEPLPVLSGTPFVAEITGGGDADLYVRFDASPTVSEWDCRPYLAGSAETCSLEVPATASLAHVMVRGYTAATYTLTVSWVEP